MKKIFVLLFSTFSVLLSSAQTNNIEFEGFISGKPVNLKLRNEIFTNDSLEIAIYDNNGTKYSTDGFSAKYFSLAETKTQRQEMEFQKVFAKKFNAKDSNKIKFRVKDLLIDKDFYRVKIVLNKISYWDIKKSKWVEVSVHPEKRTFTFNYYK